MPTQTCTILVVDDEPELLQTIAANVEAEGYRVIEASDGEQGLRVLEQTPDVDLVLLDIRMPRVDGVETLRRMKQIRPDLPVILMTAYAIQEREVEAVRHGAYTLIRKPFDMDAMFKLIARALRNPAVLIVSADPADREALAEAVRACGQRAIVVGSTADLSDDVLQSGGVDIAVLVGGDREAALATLTQLYAIAPSLPIVLVTAEPPGNGHPRGAAIAAWVPKPVSGSDLTRMVSQLRSAAR